ncbi:MAG: fused MFS/spermidine synthase [Candidatus Parcubacteria bacterium]|nr:fused MFS/spermidine synthase [Candidatus Parcubacteria bacterium]
MAIEISASRLIAPYFGTSTFVWTNVIGVIMVALALGYFFGGKLADKKPDLNQLLKIILLACLVLLIIPFVTSPLVEFLSKNIFVVRSASLLIFGGSLVTVSLLFIFPIFLLGIVSPFIIKLMANLDPQLGKDAGLVFSVSTIGSIFGTFLPVLVFIPYLGTRKTIIAFSLILLFICLLGLLKKSWLALFLILLTPIFFMPWPQIKTAQGAISEGESVYQYFQVIDKNNLRYLNINEGLAIFSILNKDKDNVLTHSYFDYYNLLPYLDNNGKEQNILILGLAGGTISTQLNHFFAKDYNLQIDGVEIDKKIIDLAKKYFNLANPSLIIHNFDGRNFLDITDKKYNAIVIDVYANQLYISFQLTTEEFFTLVKKHLSVNGVVAMNVNASSIDSALLKNITNTMKLVFKNVYLVQVPNSLNYMVLASENDLDFTKLENLNKIEELKPIIGNIVNAVSKVSYDNNFGYLTDDKAPIEHLTDWMILDYLFK